MRGVGARWVRPRICRICGHVGCRDNSRNRHARGHWRATGQPIVGSMELRGHWPYCFEDDEFL